MENIKDLKRNDGRKIQRGAETKERIKDAFITLYANRPIEKISIKMITDLAGLNRCTFYLHFTDIYDLREQIEREFFELIRDKVQGALKELFQHGDLMNALPSIDFYKEHKKYLEVLLCSYGKSHLGETMKQEVKESIRKMIQLGSGHDNTFTEYALEYFTSAMLGVLIYWIKQDMQLPMKSLSEFMTDITEMGSVPYLLKSVGIENLK